MSQQDEYESERTATPGEAAAVLSAVADGLLTGSVRLGEGDEALAVDIPEELELEVEFEHEDDELSLELELEWPAPEGEGSISPTEAADASGTTEGEADAEADESGADSHVEDELTIPVAATDATESLARFEVFRDRGDQWRWRLRHRNGNIIATSGEGYTQKHNAWNGLESVMANAPEAAVQEATEE